PEPAAPAPILLAHAPAPAKAPTNPAPAASQGSATTMTAAVAKRVERLQSSYEATAGCSAAFEQAYTYLPVKRTDTASGTVIFKKPGLMRWEYLKPSKRTFVLAGNRVYAYAPEARTLSVAAMETSQHSASVSFL